ncbi:nuclease-related domain-containing protein [Terrabacter sp. NPDC080008]|uniref:nuclease-related domain-containing protein n=1 Tax=Terrabacter sp. NPDC080008 TaxID=3155176 RepID=UPI00344F3800
MAAGGSAQSRADELRSQAAQARARAEALESEAGAWAAGADGERRVAALLAQLPAGWQVLHDRLLRPGRTQTNLDHIVLGPSGAYLVDTKNWAGGMSVHDATLWQHASGSSPKSRELDTVSRFAAEMEKALGQPVVPVVALADCGSSAFQQQRVRGVEVVPHTGLTGWLLRQPGAADPVETQLAARRVENLFPAASATPAPSATPLTVPDVVGGSTPSEAREPLASPRRGRRPRTIRQTPSGTLHGPGRDGGRRGAVSESRPVTRRRRPVVSAFLALGAFIALEGLASFVLSHGSASTSPPGAVPLVASPRSTSASVAISKPCLAALSTKDVARITGSKIVVDKSTGSDDLCGWWLAKPRYTTEPADISVETGRLARVRLTSSGAAAARLDRLPGEVSAWVPVGTRLDGWPVKLRTNATFLVSLRFRYPPGADQARARAVEAAAETTLTHLAAVLANRLPPDPAG